VSNDPAPDLVRLNIGIGGSRLHDLSSAVAPIIPPPALPPNAPPAGSIKPQISSKQLSSSFSMSVNYYMIGKVTEQAGGGADDPFGVWNTPYSTGGDPFGIGEGLP
jgi:hypothetical protein